MNSRQDTLPKRDNEALCAYLDGVMTGEERLKFEKRLAKSLRLQKALKEYTQLRLAVRSLPCQPAPRNFSLTREEVRALKRQPVLYPAFSFASLAAVLILALVFTSEFIFKTYSAPMAREVSSEATLSAAPSQENARDVPEQPLIFTWGGAYGMGGGGAGGIGGDAPAAAYGMGGGLSAGTTIVGNTGEEQAAKPGEITAPLPSEGAGAGLLETPEEEAPQAQVFSALTSSEPVEPLIFGIRESEAGQIIASYPPAEAKTAPETAADIQTEANPALVSDVLKIGLLASAFVLALLALVFYLKR
jgi:anti-sigma factor RsiW